MNDLVPLPKAKYTYTALSRNYDFAGTVKWKTFERSNPHHLEILKNQEDPISLEDLQDTLVSGDDEVVQLSCATEKYRCNYTKQSITQAFMAKPECVVCHTTYKIPGTQPSGRMSYYSDRNSDCSGYAGIGSIVMYWSFKSGTQGPNHMHPGKPYTGGKKQAFLPDNMEGRRALFLIIKAFRRGHLFTVARSYTLKGGPRLTFSSIHLKSARSGGAIYHGWPDTNYFMRLKSECAGKMIFDDATEKEMDKMHEGTSPDII